MKSTVGYCNLTEQETAVLKCLTHGMNNHEIAQKLTVQLCTVKAHLTSIMKKLQVRDRLQAAIKAINQGLFKDEE